MRTKLFSNSSPRRTGFTLIEIMVVLAVIAIIATIAVPAMNGVMKGSKVTQSADELERDLARARAAAIRENIPIEFRFYKLSDPEQPNSSESYRAYQAVRRIRDPQDHTVTVDIEPIFEVKFLPPGVIFSDSGKASTILKLPDIPDNVARDGGTYNDAIPRVEEAEYAAFYFRPDGSTSLVSSDEGGGGEKWCVTIVREVHADGALPDDFVTYQVDAFNGQVRRYEKKIN